MGSGGVLRGGCDLAGGGGPPFGCDEGIGGGPPDETIGGGTVGGRVDGGKGALLFGGFVVGRGGAASITMLMSH